MNNDECLEFIKQNKIFCFKMNYAGKELEYAVTLIGPTEIKNWFHTIDLKYDPNDYLMLNNDEFVNKIREVHKILISHESPRLSVIDNCLDNDIYKSIGIKELNNRADILKNSNDLLNKLNLITKKLQNTKS